GEINVELRIRFRDLRADVGDDLVNSAVAVALEQHGDIPGVGFRDGGEAELKTGAAGGAGHLRRRAQDAFDPLEHGIGLGERAARRHHVIEDKAAFIHFREQVGAERLVAEIRSRDQRQAHEGKPHRPRQRAAQPALVEPNDAAEKPRKRGFLGGQQLLHLARARRRRCRRRFAPPSPRKYWLSTGVQVSARASEVSSATPTVMASARKNTPVTPVIEINGTKTTMGVMVEPTNGLVISARAARMASARPLPASRWSTMFSTTTMASSITSPTAAARPPRLMRLKLCPSAAMTTNVIRIVAGITSPATSEVPQSRRNSTITMDARTRPMRMASRTPRMDSPTMVD